MRPVAAGQLGRDQGPRQHGDVRQDRQHHPGQAQVGRVLLHSGGELPVKEQGHHQLQRQPGPGGRQHVGLCSGLDQDQGGLLMVRGWRGVSSSLAHTDTRDAGGQPVSMTPVDKVIVTNFKSENYISVFNIKLQSTERNHLLL